MFRLALCCLLCAPGLLSAQSDSLPDQHVPEVTIAATRMETAENRLPFAVTVLEKTMLQKAQPQRSLQEALVAVPGVLALNADNYAQDLRLSVRGFGARAAFGIRGLRVFTDGLPESTPDGTTDMDQTDAGMLRRIEVLRGATAGIYGNASGGVLHLSSENPPEQPALHLLATTGSFGYRRYQLKGGTTFGKVGIMAALAHNRLQGYRTQSAMQQTSFYAKARWQPWGNTKMTFVCNLADSPRAEDAGGLTEEQVQADRRQARAANVNWKAGETVRQERVGVIWEQLLQPALSLKTTAFLTRRRFANRLAFQNGGWVQFDRLFGGANAVLRWHKGQYRTQTGVEWQQQRDDRDRYNNLNGEKGDLVFQQKEQYGNLALFWTNEYVLQKRWTFLASTRWDALQLSAADRFLTDGDQSGSRKYGRFNPALGVAFQATEAVALYANAASNFETPTLNELSANPDNTGGFNPALRPQSAAHIEAGSKMRFHKTLFCTVALYHIALQNEITAYQLAPMPGRIFFRNVGRSRRTGIETALQWSPLPGLALQMHGTLTDFRYRRYESAAGNFDGKRPPLQPRIAAFALLQWESRSGWFVALQTQHQGKVFLNDANDAIAPAYTLTALRSSKTFRYRHYALEPFVGVQNALYQPYYNNLLVNAPGNRFFEPAPDFATFYGGIVVRLRQM